MKRLSLGAQFLLAGVAALSVGSARAANNPPAEALRAGVCLNGIWQVAPATDEVKIPDGAWTVARVPAAPILDPAIHARWQRLLFQAPKEWRAPGRGFFLQIEKAGHYAAVLCNGKLVAEHYGQYTPFEANLTNDLRPGEQNEIAVYVHNASGRFVRPGTVIDDEMVGRAYRPAADFDEQRNWIGVVGDVTLSWRPLIGLGDVFVDTSVREKSLNILAEIHPPIAAGDPPLTIRATVLDGNKAALELPAQPTGAEGKAELTSPWADPILWGSPPYGAPKLYTLRTELLHDGAVIDRVFTPFGFREVWIEGRDLLLNGRKLWLVGEYHGKISLLRSLNDRHPFAGVNRAMQAAGLNTVHGHWDDLGDPWLNVCDETGMFVLAGFFCDGRPKIQSKADAGWADWITSTCAEWVRARRNHPSILVWRPIDVPPSGLQHFIATPDLQARLAAEVRRLDPAHRPLADNSDVTAWGQPPQNADTGVMDNVAPLEAAAKTGKPFLNKEIYCGFQNPELLSGFFRLFYDRSFALGSSGMLVQHLPLMASSGSSTFAISWLSQSGPGNRDAPARGGRDELPNWCDPSQPTRGESVYAELFRDLSRQYLATEPRPAEASNSGDLLLAGAPPGSVVFLAPEDPLARETLGVLAAPDGTAWLTAAPGRWSLTAGSCHHEIQIEPPRAPSVPGYAAVARVTFDDAQK